MVTNFLNYGFNFQFIFDIQTNIFLDFIVFIAMNSFRFRINLNVL